MLTQYKKTSKWFKFNRKNHDRGIKGHSGIWPTTMSSLHGGQILNPTLPSEKSKKLTLP